MKFQIASDLHIEFAGAKEKMPQIPVKSKILCLLGDIGYPHKPGYEEYLMYQANRFSKVFVVAGNHEYYGSELYETKVRMKEVCEKHPNLIYMDRTSYLCEMDGEKVRFLGTTLWSNVDDDVKQMVSRGLNDYALIQVKDENKKRKLTVDDTNKMHKQEVEWLTKELKDAKERNEVVVVLTHHAPLVNGTSAPQYEGSALNAAFATDLSHLCDSHLAVWAFGHTHYSSKQMCKKTVIVSNQLGYIVFSEKSGFNPELVLSAP